MRLTLDHVACEGRVGVKESERGKPQPLTLRITLQYDAGKAIAGDDLDEAVDYSRVLKVARAAVAEKPYRLIETAASAVARALGETFPCARVEATVTKHPYGDEISASATAAWNRERP